jgi:cytidylate kinase
MGNELFTYLNKRVNRTGIHTDLSGKPAGPVVTISREVGCSGLELADALAERLNHLNMTGNWKVLSKEIFQQSALELNIDPEKIAKIFKQSNRNVFDEILNTLSEKRFKSDKKIKKTVCDVIRSFAEDGFCIIVGRGGNYLAAGIRNSIHIRLVAPLEDRINSIMYKNGLNHEEAVNFITRVEKERLAYRHAVMSKITDEPEIFDITFNRSVFTTEMIVDITLLAIKNKQILNDYMKKN